MAFDRSSSKLERLAGGAHKLFVYLTADTIATVTGAGYFNNLAGELDQFDVIMVVSETGGTPKFDTVVVTSASRAAAVTTTATEGVTATVLDADEEDAETTDKAKAKTDKAEAKDKKT